MSTRAFTEAQESEILQMRAIGIPTGDIVTEFAGRRNAVYAVFKRAGVPLEATGPTTRLATSAERLRAAELWGQGYSVTAIARELRRSPDWTQRALSQHGVELETKNLAGQLVCHDCGSYDVRPAPGEGADDDHTGSS